jgi:pimeloyl-ACP methyl ester carboxylesterase
MGKKVKYNRRHFLNNAARAIGGYEFAMIGLTSSTVIGDDKQPAAINGYNDTKSLGPIKQIHAGLLNVGYTEVGPPNGSPVILLHGWPYDIHSFDDVAPSLASSGYRVIIPFLRGYGTTEFLSGETFRNGQPSALAVDLIDLMDVLRIDKAIIAGFDWGARTADIIAALWPQRCKAIVSVSGYLIGSRDAGKIPLAQKLNCNGGINIILQQSEANWAMKDIGETLPS